MFRPGDRVEFKSSDPRAPWKPAVVAPTESYGVGVDGHRRHRDHPFIRLQVSPRVFIVRHRKLVRLAPVLAASG